MTNPKPRTKPKAPRAGRPVSTGRGRKRGRTVLVTLTQGEHARLVEAAGDDPLGRWVREAALAQADRATGGAWP